jgi:hypothetical protein
MLLVLLSLTLAGAAGSQPRRAPTPLPRWPRRADPAPMVTRGYLDLGVVLEDGKVKVRSVSKGQLREAKALLPRFAGRFEVKLYVHSLLRDVVRFNFPLTGGMGERPSTQDPLGRGLSLGVTARTTVRIPFDDSITAVVIDDTATKKRSSVDLSRVRPPPRPPALPLPGPTRTGTFKKKS